MSGRSQPNGTECCMIDVSPSSILAKTGKPAPSVCIWPPWCGTSPRQSCLWRRAEVKGHREQKVLGTLSPPPHGAKTSHTPWTSVPRPIASVVTLDNKQKGALSGAIKHLGVAFGGLASLPHHPYPFTRLPPQRPIYPHAN